MSMKVRRRISSGIWTVIGVIIFLIMMFPIYWMLIASLMTETQIFSVPPYFIPPTPSLEAYTFIFTSDSFHVGQLFVNSIIISASTMILAVALSLPASYSLAKFDIKFKKIVILIFLISQMLPAVFNLIPYFFIFRSLEIQNTYLAPIIANMTTAIPFSIIMLRPYFQSIPDGLLDAARIDGSSHINTFVHIMMPVCAPGICVSLVFSFLFAYSDMIYAKTFLNDTLMWPLTTGIYQTIGRYNIQWSRAMAFAVVVCLPVLLIFIFMQRYIVDGLLSGSVKG